MCLQKKEPGKQSVVTEGKGRFQALTPVGRMGCKLLSISESQVWHHENENVWVTLRIR